MRTRRNFLKKTGAIALGSMLLPSCGNNSNTPGTTTGDSTNTTADNAANQKIENIGVQLYTFRKEMQADPTGTLKKIAALGFTQIESARSDKGNYYGLTPKEIKQICNDHGMTLRSGHVHIDDKWQQTLEQAAEAGQEYLVCSTMPTEGQTVDNYKTVAAAFNKAGEDCKKLNIRFGYHNHEYEFEQEKGTVLYDVLLDNTDSALVHMELDLGWVIVGGKDPLDYFKRYEGRFPLWHLKDMDMQKKQSTEFGKGSLQIENILKQRKESGVKYIFVEQEEYTVGPWESMKHNMKYLSEVKL